MNDGAPARALETKTGAAKTGANKTDEERMGPRHSPAPGSGVIVEFVAGRRHRKAFLDLPLRIHRDDPSWIAPLRMVEADRLNPRKHAFYEDGEAAFWVAYRAGVPVGRISAQVDGLHLRRYADATGHFGMLEAIDDPAVFEALFASAEAWLRERGIERVTGPFSLSVNEESGLLVDGFEHPPAIMSDHALRYYGPRVEEVGYRKAKDLYAFDFDFGVPLRDRFLRLAGMLARYPNITLRPSHPGRLVEECHTAIDIFNDAWSENWHFVPFTRRYADAVIENIKHFMSTNFLWFAEDGDRPIAFVMALPDLNQASKGLDGRLLPFGWLRFLWRAKVTGLQRGRLAFLGVRKEYQSSALAATITANLMLSMYRTGVDLGLTHADISWVLEDNTRLLRIAEHGGLKRYKTFRVYERVLSPEDGAGLSGPPEAGTARQRAS